MYLIKNNKLSILSSKLSILSNKLSILSKKLIISSNLCILVQAILVQAILVQRYSCAPNNNKLNKRTTLKDVVARYTANVCDRTWFLQDRARCRC